MSFPEKTLHTLEFDKVREMLAACALTQGAADRARALVPYDDEELVLRYQRLTTDTRRLAEAKGMPSFGAVKDVTGACERADKGATLSTRELLDVGDILRTARGLLDYCHGNHLFDTVLDQVFDRLMPSKTLEESIFRTILSEDMIADEASPALGDIRRKIRATNAKIKDTLQKFVAGGSYSKYLQENIVTTRGGRYVVPVKVECKNEVRGLIHDTSASGQTVFVEPMAVVEANNELRVLEAKEEREVERILAGLSQRVSECGSAISLNYHNITALAFYFACAELSMQMQATAPQITPERGIRLRHARHPLIPKDKVVPIDVSLGVDFDTLIITGPNTGGKTVTLKTLGLFSLMAQAGLHIPCDDQSSICVFSHILVDLGDEQSIEQSLSTFSSHMVNIVSIMGQVDRHSLVLFDELGVGTDPTEGAALAQAVIESVRDIGALCAATTHYAELKAYALQTPGVINGSCEFNVETLKPTYKLSIGTPGKSNAFAISQRLGLPISIIERAKQHISTDSRRFEDVIGQLEHARMEAEQMREETEQMRREYEHFKEESEARIKRQLAEAEKATREAQQKATALIESAKASSNYIMEQMDRVRKARDSARLGQKMDAARKAVREHLKENEDQFNPVVRKEEPDDGTYVLPRPLKKGDEVTVRSLGTKATVLDPPDKNGNVQVQAGILRTRVPLSEIRLVTEKETAPQKNTRNEGVTVNRASSFRSEIDLRGMTGEEAWLEVDKYLDGASLSGMHTLYLIHGKGTGALRNALWKFLKGDKRVASFRIGKYGEGDGGVTVVELK